MDKRKYKDIKMGKKDARLPQEIRPESWVFKQNVRNKKLGIMGQVI